MEKIIPISLPSRRGDKNAVDCENNSNQYLERTLGRLHKRTGFQWIQWGVALGGGFIVFVMVPFWFLCSSSLPPVFSTEQPEEGIEGRGSRGKTCIHTYG